MIKSTILTPIAVRFRGPALHRMARGALSAAGASVIERNASVEWGPQLQEYVVSVEARDAEDAVKRVRQALEAHGAYDRFSSNEKVSRMMELSLQG